MASHEGDSNGLSDRLRRADPGALAELFSLHRGRLRRMVAVRLDHRLNGRVSPSDVLQEAFIDALQRLPHYFAKPDMPLFGWLRLVVGQRLIEVHRQHLGAQARDATQEIALPRGAVAAASSASLAAQLVGHLTSPSQAALRNEACAQLEEALGRLDPLDREVLTLRHFEELGNQEVAEVLGIQRAAASKRYVRALARLRTVLEAIPGFFDEQA
jgi:RNA polymerase sigma-70 factor (ECF subfamily)